MSSVFLLLLILLQIKHWYIDFVIQTEEEVKHKGIYLDWRGIKHSVKHGIGTALVFFFFVPLEGALLIGIVDAVLHYHIDWVKMNYGNRDIANPKFWNHLGLDQMAHQIVYLGLVSILIL